MVNGKDEGEAMPVQANYTPRGFQKVKASRFIDSRHIKAVKLSALRTGRL